MKIGRRYNFLGSEYYAVVYDSRSAFVVSCEDSAAVGVNLAESPFSSYILGHKDITLLDGMKCSHINFMKIQNSKRRHQSEDPKGGRT